MWSIELMPVIPLSQENGHAANEDTPVIEEEPQGYEYSADVKAWETFTNIMRGYRVALQEGSGRRVTFSSDKLIDMKGMKESGVLWSYAIAKVKKVTELAEVG